MLDQAQAGLGNPGASGDAGVDLSQPPADPGGERLRPRRRRRCPASALRAQKPTRPPISIRRRATASTRSSGRSRRKRSTPATTTSTNSAPSKNIAERRRGAADPAVGGDDRRPGREAEQTFAIDDLIRKMPLEERLYRHRCVEAWSMTVPWTGFPLADAGRAGQAARRRELSPHGDLHRSRTWRPARSRFWYPWPYVEGLTIAEATNELAFLVTGAYGKPVAKPHGRAAPPPPAVEVRLQVDQVDRPLHLHRRAAGQLLGAARSRPNTASGPTSIRRCRIRAGARRWSATSPPAKSIPTQLFNGYGEYVAGLYAGHGRRAALHVRRRTVPHWHRVADCADMQSGNKKPGPRARQFFAASATRAANLPEGNSRHGQRGVGRN